MAGELKTTFQTGQTVTARILSAAGQVGGSIGCPEVGTTGLYIGSVPNGTPAGEYVVTFHVLGAQIASGPLNWDGAAEVAGEVPPTLLSQMVDVWRRLGLDPDNPLMNSNTAITAGPLNMTVEVTTSNTKVTRQ